MTLTTFVTVIQISASKFDVFKFNGTSQKSIHPQTREKGALVTCWESTSQNDDYCFKLAEKMNQDAKK